MVKINKINSKEVEAYDEDFFLKDGQLFRNGEDSIAYSQERR